MNCWQLLKGMGALGFFFFPFAFLVFYNDFHSHSNWRKINLRKNRGPWSPWLESLPFHYFAQIVDGEEKKKKKSHICTQATKRDQWPHRLTKKAEHELRTSPLVTCGSGRQTVPAFWGQPRWRCLQGESYRQDTAQAGPTFAPIKCEKESTRR